MPTCEVEQVSGWYFFSLSLTANIFSGRKMESYGTTSWIAWCRCERRKRKTVNKTFRLRRIQRKTPHCVSQQTSVLYWVGKEILLKLLLNVSSVYLENLV